MLYRIKHITKYQYHNLVNQSYSEVRLSPKNTVFQNCVWKNLSIYPQVHTLSERVDFFESIVHSFTICQPHKMLEIVAECTVSVLPRTNYNLEQGTSTWENVQKQLKGFDPSLLDVKQYTLSSPHLLPVAAIAHFAKDIFDQEPILLNAVKKLMYTIFQEFEFKSGYTTISTPLQDVIKIRKGVCQDFAHVAIASLRSVGLAARYVSGYLETIPPIGKAKLVGADASHAWVSVYIPEYGWVDFDPTNNIFVNDQHITLGWGRDYADIAPVRGVVYSEGKQQMETSVDVMRVE